MIDYDWFDYSKLTAARHVSGYRVFLAFEDGTAGEFDLYPLVAPFKGVFESLRDEAEFARFTLAGGPTIEWSCGADISPEALYHLARGRRLPLEEWAAARERHEAPEG